MAAFLKDHANPATAPDGFDPDQVVLAGSEPADFAEAMNPEARAAIKEAVTYAGVDLSARDIAALVAFLETLTDPVALTGRLGVPETVPSGLDVPQGFSTTRLSP